MLVFLVVFIRVVFSQNVDDDGTWKVPDKPTNVFIMADNDAILIQWDKVVEGTGNGSEPQGYTIGWSVGSHDDFMMMVVEDTNSFIIDALEPNTVYNISISAYNEFGESESIFKFIRTLPLENTTGEYESVDYAPIEIPPFFVDAQVLSSTSVIVRWTTDPLNHTSKDFIPGTYTLQYGIKGSADYKNETTTEQNIVVKNLKPDTEYEFRVQLVIDSGLHFDFTSFDVVRTLQAAPTSPPYGFVTITSSTSSIFVSWQPPAESNGPITGYELNYTIDGYKKTEKLYGDTREFTIQDLPLGEVYFQVRAKNEHGYGPFSPVVKHILSKITLFYPSTTSTTLVQTTPLSTTSFLTSTSSVTNEIDCEFEKVACGWISDPKSTLNWQRVESGQKGLSMTLPTDHTSLMTPLDDSEGHFMYIEGLENESGVGRIVSPIVMHEPNLKWCLNLWYFVQPMTSGKMIIHIIPLDSRNLKPDAKIVSLINEDSQWQQLTHQLETPNGDFRIELEVAKQADAKLALAIDDIQVTPGTCREVSTQQEVDREVTKDDETEIDLLQAVKIPFQDSHLYIDKGLENMPSIGFRQGAQVRRPSRSHLPKTLFPDFAILATVKPTTDNEGYLFAVTDPYDTTVEFGLHLQPEGAQTKINLIYSNQQKGGKAKILETFIVPRFTNKWTQFAIKVEKDEIELYFNCRLNQKFGPSGDERHPKRLQFDDASKLYIAWAGPIIHKQFVVKLNFLHFFLKGIVHFQKLFTRLLCIDVSGTVLSFPI